MFPQIALSFLIAAFVLLPQTHAHVREVSPPSIRPYTNSSMYFLGSVTVTLDINSPDTVVYYTVNGQKPTNTSFLYKRPIRLTTVGTTTIKCYAVSITPDRTDSIIVSATYNIAPSDVPVPRHSPPSNTFRMEVNVTLTFDPDLYIVRYTLNGGTPTTQSPQYRGPILINTIGENILQFFAQAVVGGAVSPVALKVYTIHPALAYEITTECKTCQSATAGKRFTVWIHGATYGAHSSMFLTTAIDGCENVNAFLDNIQPVVLIGPSVSFLTKQGPCFVYVCYRDSPAVAYARVPSVANPRNADPAPFLVQPMQGSGGGVQTPPVAVRTDPPALPPVNLVPDSGYSTGGASSSNSQEVQSAWSSWALMLGVLLVPTGLIGYYCYRTDRNKKPVVMTAVSHIDYEN